MADGFDFSELNTLAAKLNDRGRGAGAAASRVLRRSAAAVERDAKMFCPVDTGFLRSSIGTDFEGDGRFTKMAADIGPTAAYGAYVEFGTSRMAPRAYLGPALDRNTPAFVAAIEQLGGEIL